MIPPLSIQQFVEGSDFCWVFFFYTSDQPDFNGPYGFAKSLATYFAERCMVGTINMSYPANQATFHNVFGTECVYEDDRPAYERILTWNYDLIHGRPYRWYELVRNRTWYGFLIRDFICTVHGTKFGIQIRTGTG